MEQQTTLNNETKDMNETQNIKNGLPIKTLILIILLATVTIGLTVYAFLSYNKSLNSTPEVVNTVTPTTSDPAQTTITVSSLPVKLSTPSAYTTDITINTGTNNVNKVQLELSYDPKVLTKVDITPGKFFTDSKLLLKNIDKINGRISYAIGVQDGDAGVLGQGVLATLNFIVIQKNATASVTLLPKTQVTADGYSQSVLKTTINGLFNLTTPLKSTSSGKY